MTALLQIDDLSVWFGRWESVAGAAAKRLQRGRHRASDAERGRLFAAARRCYGRLQA